MARVKMLEPGRGYRFRVRGVNCEGQGGPVSESVVSSENFPGYGECPTHMLYVFVPVYRLRCQNAKDRKKDQVPHTTVSTERVCCSVSWVYPFPAYRRFRSHARCSGGTVASFVLARYLVARFATA